ncbi:MAG: GNAT family N-acetyltransferase [Gaiellaceae bacterium MAG52_C11]|nr:GNAT family N-acetyltransferase [Candidatus Gaiellasilicea maunaloa]
MSVRIRRLRYRDLPAVGRIERAAFGTPWPAREFAFELAKPSGLCLAAVTEDGLAGYLVACPQGRLWNLRNVAVATSSRRLGVGSTLLRALLESERVAGSNVVLEVRESERGAIALYERFGFYVAGRRPEFYGDNHEDAVLMWCSSPRR